MKLQCPHCGVKGSAEDSYSGRKVKCPKCQGLFELQPEMAFELTESSRLVSELVSTPLEQAAPVGEVELPRAAEIGLSEVEADEAIAVEDLEKSVEIEQELTEPGQETTSSSDEEVLDWDDIASEIDLELAQGDMKDELEESQEDGPAELSSIQDEFEIPASDFDLTAEEDLAEIAETDLTQESPLLDPVDLESPEQEMADELEETVESTENYAEGDVEDEVPLVQEDEEIELEPYGIDKEQCWQCGKKETLGESFVARDDRLYCTDCAPVEDLEETVDDSQEQEADDQDLTDDAASLNYEKFSIGDGIRQSWAMIKGAKGAIWAGSAIMYLVILVIVAGGAFLLPSLDGDPGNVTGLVVDILLQSVTNIFSVLFTAGLLLMGIRKVAGDRISWKMIFKGFSCAGKLIVATILQFILVAIGFLLLILPGIYLAVGYAMTVPLIVDKGLSPWQAMEMSRKAIHKIWWKVAGLFVVMGVIFVVSLIPLGIGLIWTWPMFIILAGVVYLQLFGNKEQTS